MKFLSWFCKPKKVIKDKSAAEVFSEWETMASTKGFGQGRKLLLSCISSITSGWAFNIYRHTHFGNKAPSTTSVRTRDLELVHLVISRLNIEYETVDEWAPALWDNGFKEALYVINRAQGIYLKYASQPLSVLKAVAESDVPCPDRVLVKALYEARRDGYEYKTPVSQFWPYIEVCCLLGGDRSQSEYLEEDFTLTGFTDHHEALSRLRGLLWG